MTWEAVAAVMSIETQYFVLFSATSLHAVLILSLRLNVLISFG